MPGESVRHLHLALLAKDDVSWGLLFQENNRDLGKIAKEQAHPQLSVSAPSAPKYLRISACSPLQTDQWGITTKESSEMRERATGAPTEGTVSEQHPELHNLVLEMAQIQEFKEAFTIMDQNRDGFIDKADLRDTFAALGRLNVKNEELDDMIKEAPGPINFTVFLSMFGEKLKGADPEETILNAFKVFDPESKGLKANYIKEMLMTQGERFSKEEVDQMFAAFPPDVTGNLDYKNLVHIITHGEEKD
ncbi:hypothetical protein Chor_012908 [Crotalus horridus]